MKSRRRTGTSARPESIRDDERVRSEVEQKARESHLRAHSEVSGYSIEFGYSVHGVDGLLGHLDDLLIDDESWRVATLLVDAREWRPGENVGVSPVFVRAVDWKTREIRLSLRRGEVQP